MRSTWVPFHKFSKHLVVSVAIFRSSKSKLADLLALFGLLHTVQGEVVEYLKTASRCQWKEGKSVRHQLWTKPSACCQKWQKIVVGPWRSPDFMGKRYLDSVPINWFIPQNGGNCRKIFQKRRFFFLEETKAAELAEPWRRWGGEVEAEILKPGRCRKGFLILISLSLYFFL